MLISLGFKRFTFSIDSVTNQINMETNDLILNKKKTYPHKIFLKMTQLNTWLLIRKQMYKKVVLLKNFENSNLYQQQKPVCSYSRHERHTSTVVRRPPSQTVPWNGFYRQNCYRNRCQFRHRCSNCQVVFSTWSYTGASWSK